MPVEGPNDADPDAAPSDAAPSAAPSAAKSVSADPPAFDPPCALASLNEGTQSCIVPTTTPLVSRLLWRASRSRS